MFCSIIIPTIGRDTLVRAVNSALMQTADQPIEVVVVNDSGKELDLGNPCFKYVRVLNTNRRERSTARNVGAAVAKGQFLCFLDDDDWLLPEAVEIWHGLHVQTPSADWLYGRILVVNNASQVLGASNTRLNGFRFAQVLGGDWVPIQTSAIRSETFFMLRGFDPTINGTEDLDLCLRYSSKGEFANSDRAIACLFRGPSWKQTTSTDYLKATVAQRLSRQAAVGNPGSLRKLLKSSEGPYSYGRLSHVFISLILFNTRHGRVLKAFTRLGQMIIVLLNCNWRFIRPTFWSGLRDDHTPESLHFIVQKIEQTEHQETLRQDNQKP